MALVSPQIGGSLLKTWWKLHFFLMEPRVVFSDPPGLTVFPKSRNIQVLLQVLIRLLKFKLQPLAIHVFLCKLLGQLQP